MTILVPRDHENTRNCLLEKYQTQFQRRWGLGTRLGTMLVISLKEVSLPKESLKAASLQGGVLVPRPYWKLVRGVAALIKYLCPCLVGRTSCGCGFAPHNALVFT